MRFSGDSKKWDEALTVKQNAISQSIITDANLMLVRRFYTNDVTITRLETFSKGSTQKSGLLVHGVVNQHRLLLGENPWDNDQIICVLFQGNYSDVISYYNGNPTDAKLLAVALDADFGPILTTDGAWLIAICVFFVIITVIGVVSVLLILKLFITKTDNLKEYNESIYEAPIFLPNRTASFISNARTNSSLHLESIDEPRNPLVVRNPLRTTENVTSEMNSFAPELYKSHPLNPPAMEGPGPELYTARSFTASNKELDQRDRTPTPQV
ncbi:unnamed protein product [Phytomonas sp. Hart1]|nr:unnamed protein product [Phytomonas sp. Hart1]|eukprot:CCW71334.1 unnamed protein product [Phytomonas sp. isolate Hart1]